MAIAVVSDWLELKLGEVAMETLRPFTGGAFEARAEGVEDASVVVGLGEECGVGMLGQNVTESSLCKRPQREQTCFPWEHLL